MSITTNTISLVRIAPKTRAFSAGTGRLALLLLLMSALIQFSRPALGEEPEDRYIHVFDLIQQGDSLNTQNQPADALVKYQEALKGIRNFQVTYPAFNVKMINYRSNDVATKIATLSAKLNPPAEAEASGAPAAGDSKTGTPGKSAGGAAQVKLISAGAEPRKALRLHPAPGDKQTLTMTMKMDMGIKVGEVEQPMKIPGMKMVMDSTVKTVSPEGDIEYESVATDADIVEDKDAQPQVAEAMKNSLGGLKGLVATGVLTSRGISKGSDVKVPEGADPQTRQAIDQMKEAVSRVSAPFPEEPVGAGAKWEVRMKIKSQGLSIDQTATYELVSADGDRLTVKTGIAQTAANQKIQNPAMPGLKLDLTKMTGKGAGQTIFDLARVMPAEGDMDMKSELVMAMNTGASKQTMNMQMGIALHFEGK